MKNYDWTIPVKSLYQEALQRYRDGHREPRTFFTPYEQQTLASIGASPAELFDYAEDAESLDWETALLILAVRRDYFLVIQRGIPASHAWSMADFPAKTAEIDGIPWLPRLIQKAQARLRGELPADLMYCCAGDRRFFSEHNIHPADFLREAWAAGGDEKKIVAYVKKSRS